ncbi:hypothetical protein AWB75_05704 [Caballeronia catudaia]|uniref:Uncharacterized protein n=1 Tax=Caballeronia catudaia TaxID=1777136 RepID=A0A158CTB3_9BURK|nr:hypothetical protein [Caballeronia catudaia]SAK85569.1 hypothetical protein AWB75_05704 [Caballeronia catudaia]
MPNFLIRCEYRHKSVRFLKPSVICDRVVIASETAEHARRILQARGDASCAKHADGSYSFHVLEVIRAPDHLHAF